MSDDVSEALKRRRERRERLAKELESNNAEDTLRERNMGDDEAAARREARRREREARRKEREAEAASAEDSARARRHRKEEADESASTRSSERDSDSYESASARRRREREQQQEEEAKAERQRREREEAEARERERERERRRREEQEAEERRQREKEEEEADRRRRQRDAERSYNSGRGHYREQENQEDEVEEEEETIFDRMSPQKKASILEGLAEEFRRIVEEREAKGQMVAVSAQELDELDLKVRSLRTQVRKAEENNNQLTKQKREIDEKLKKNENELNKLRNELQSAEAENELAIKEGKKVAPKLPTGPAKKKASPFGGGFINVVRKAQSAAWEEKFKAMKDKKKGSEPKVAPKPKRSGRLTDKSSTTYPRYNHEKTTTLPTQTLEQETKANRIEKEPPLVSPRRAHAQRSLDKSTLPDVKKKERTEERSSESVSTRRAHARTSVHKSESRDVKESKPARRAHAHSSSKSKSDPPEVPPKPRWRSSSFSKLNEPVPLSPVHFNLQLSGNLTRDVVTSSPRTNSRLETRKETKIGRKESPSNPPEVKPKPWRAKLGAQELTFKGNLLTLELKTKLRSRSLVEETTAKTQEQGQYGDPDTSHTRQGNVRKFADHRRSVRQRNRHRPSTNPVRQLEKRKDIRSEL